MISHEPKDLPLRQLHQLLLGSIGPRPIAFASTIDKNGVRNLAPFSFFNVFSAKPPILIFSPARSGRTGENKHTFLNMVEVPEVVINVVTHSMVNQMSLASSPFPKETDEFIKSGFTPLESDVVKPFRVKESPIQLECKLLEINELGAEGGAGNLMICEVLKMHISQEVMDEKGLVDQEKIDLVSRMGGNWYCRANGDSLFEIDKPITSIGMGIDALPEPIRLSSQLTGNELGALGSLINLEISENIEDQINSMSKEKITLSNAKEMIKLNRLELALGILLKCEL